MLDVLTTNSLFLVLDVTIHKTVEPIFLPAAYTVQYEEKKHTKKNKVRHFAKRHFGRR
jgi:hypothetical protein